MDGVLTRLILLVIVVSAVVFPGGCNDNIDSGTLPYLGERGAGETLLNGGSEQAEANVEPVEEVTATGNGNLTIVLYFGNKEGYLTAEKRVIPKTLGVARAAMNELIKGPTAQSGLYASIPRVPG